MNRETVSRAADFLEQYAAYIHRVKPEDIEQHPYLPELEQVAADLRAAGGRRPVSGIPAPGGPRSQPQAARSGPGGFTPEQLAALMGGAAGTCRGPDVCPHDWKAAGGISETCRVCGGRDPLPF